MLKYLNILRPPLLVFKTWCDTCDNERAPAGCTPGRVAGCRLLQRVPGVTHHHRRQCLGRGLLILSGPEQGLPQLHTQHPATDWRLLIVV